ncbi:MAG TPA: restriction endonuclease subunit S [Rhodanobacteraceae bacterium]|nr:restriction endonuclease subunit S [Rhodanobacteraceae bacterium]
MSGNRRLGELLDEITVGYVGPMVDEYVEDGVPFLRSLNVKPYFVDLDDIRYITPSFHERIKKSSLRPGDVVAVRTGIPGTSCVIPESLQDANCSDLVILRCGAKVDPYYLSYYLNLIAGSHVRNQSVGAIQKHFNIASAKETPFPQIAIGEQRKIAAVLSALEAKIDLNNRINAELEALAKTIYDYWFVQFDFPDTHGRPYKSSGGKMVWNDSLNRDIPARWEARTVGSIISRAGTGLNPRNNFVLGSGTNYYVTIKNVTNGRIVLDDKCDKIDDESMAIIDRRSQLRAGDVLFTSIEPIGVTYLLHEKPTTWNINESVFTIRPDTSVISPEYLLMLLSSSEMKAFTKNSSAGSIHKGIRHAVLKSFTLAYAGRKLVDEFSLLLRPMLQKMDNLDKENRELARLRDWLLPLLMNGQVRVAGQGRVGWVEAGSVQRIPTSSGELRQEK